MNGFKISLKTTLTPLKLNIFYLFTAKQAMHISDQKCALSRPIRPSGWKPARAKGEISRENFVLVLSEAVLVLVLEKVVSPA